MSEVDRLKVEVEILTKSLKEARDKIKDMEQTLDKLGLLFNTQ
jgi:hypothetical protein